ncbi:hypothetical protein SIK60_15305 [Clostridioides difficile]|uniref:hypothetical protein n=1 Tax=Clostridioides difficile TaxID=1496 RepID=UPI0029C5CDD6|nr:hypothetical protein [Clostridioides difficile]MDX5795136.1 hypothetical protein [Clostridioides difficile]
MKPIMNLEEHNAMKEKRVKKMKSKEKLKYDDFEDISFSNKKKTKKNVRNKNAEFRNNYKNYQYDYEENFYEPI